MKYLVELVQGRSGGLTHVAARCLAVRLLVAAVAVWSVSTGAAVGQDPANGDASADLPTITIVHLDGQQEQVQVRGIEDGNLVLDGRTVGLSALRRLQHTEIGTPGSVEGATGILHMAHGGILHCSSIATFTDDAFQVTWQEQSLECIHR